jgi:hypothetical protein
MDDWYIAFSDNASEAALQQPINFTLVGGNRGVMTPAEIVLHIVNHTTYHHGYVADMFYQVPGCRQIDLLPDFENPKDLFGGVLGGSGARARIQRVA